MTSDREKTLLRIEKCFQYSTLSANSGIECRFEGGPEGAAGQARSPFLYHTAREYRSPLFRGPEKSTERSFASSEGSTSRSPTSGAVTKE